MTAIVATSERFGVASREMLTSLAIILIGLWLIVKHHELPDPTLTLVFGIAVAILATLDVIWPHVRGRAAP